MSLMSDYAFRRVANSSVLSFIYIYINSAAIARLQIAESKNTASFHVMSPARGGIRSSGIRPSAPWRS